MARLLIPATITNAAGAPSLRSLQGRVAMLPTQPLSHRTKPGCSCVRVGINWGQTGAVHPSVP